MTLRVLPTLALLPLILAAPAAAAHSFGRSYNLPMPFWLYAWGAASALVLSFVVVAIFLRQPLPAAAPRERVINASPAWRRRGARLLGVLRLGSLLALGLCIATGLFGNPNPYANFNMTLFWIVFLLGFGWLTALLGDLYRLLNPWCVLADALRRLWPAYGRGIWRYPQALGLWPALLLYMGFIVLELFGRSTPASLAWLLLGYGGFTLIGIGLFGRRDWLGQVEFLSVWFRLVAAMAPLDWREDAGGRLQLVLRRPFAGLLKMPPLRRGELLFILFMLSSTAYDGLHETVPWLRLFWTEGYQLLRPWLGDNLFAAYPLLQPWFQAWQRLALLLSPFVYLAVYLLCVAPMRRLAGGGPSWRELALRFAPSLLPIALVYHVSHYWTLILSQGLKILPLLSDPFGRGHDWFGTASWFSRPILPDAGWVWHTQVGLIVAGHVVSVAVAHREALRTFPGVRGALLSQLPMLLLMVLFTAAGLWILAQPIQAGL